MARFRCHDCKQEGSFEYAGVDACPACGSSNVQLALSIAELPDDDPLFEALRDLGDGKDEEDES